MTSIISKAALRAMSKAERQAYVEEVMRARYGFVITGRKQVERLEDGTQRVHLCTIVDGVDTGFSTAEVDGQRRIFQRVRGHYCELSIPEGVHHIKHEVTLLREAGFLPAKAERNKGFVPAA